MIPDLASLAGAAPSLLLSAGLAMGMLHAFEPDHIASVMTRSDGASRARPRTIHGTAWSGIRGSILGAFWGLGHFSTILVVSLLVFVLAVGIPPIIYHSFEVAAGVMLVALGAAVCIRSGILPWHSHVHSHLDGTIHSHPHNHRGDHAHNHASYMIGCLHGLAGSGSLVVLAAMTLGEIYDLLYFVLIFGLGSVCGMAIASGTLSIPLSLARSLGRIGRITPVITGGIGIAIGLWIIHGITMS